MAASSPSAKKGISVAYSRQQVAHVRGVFSVLPWTSRCQCLHLYLRALPSTPATTAVEKHVAQIEQSRSAKESHHS